MDEERYEVTPPDLIRLLRWCQGTPWAKVDQMVRHATAEGWLRPLPPKRDPSARATLARMPVIHDPLISEAMRALADET